MNSIAVKSALSCSWCEHGDDERYFCNQNPSAHDLWRVSKMIERPVMPQAPTATLKRAGLREAIYAKHPRLSRNDSRNLLNMFFDELAQAFTSGENVSLRGFGVFYIRSKRARVARNPRTGEAAIVSARRVLSFRAAPALIAKLNPDDGPE